MSIGSAERSPGESILFFDKEGWFLETGEAVAHYVGKCAGCQQIKTIEMIFVNKSNITQEIFCIGCGRGHLASIWPHVGETATQEPTLVHVPLQHKYADNPEFR